MQNFIFNYFIGLSFILLRVHYQELKNKKILRNFWNLKSPKFMKLLELRHLLGFLKNERHVISHDTDFSNGMRADVSTYKVTTILWNIQVNKSYKKLYCILTHSLPMHPFSISCIWNKWVNKKKVFKNVLCNFFWKTVFYKS